MSCLASAISSSHAHSNTHKLIVFKHLSMNSSPGSWNWNWPCIEIGTLGLALWIGRVAERRGEERRGEKGSGGQTRLRAAGIGLLLWAIFECQVASCHKVSEIQPKCQMSAKDIITGQLIRLPRRARPHPRLGRSSAMSTATSHHCPYLCSDSSLPSAASTRLWIVAVCCVHDGDNRYAYALRRRKRDGVGRAYGSREPYRLQSRLYECVSERETEHEREIYILGYIRQLRFGYGFIEGSQKCINCSILFAQLNLTYKVIFTQNCMPLVMAYLKKIQNRLFENFKLLGIFR